MAKAGRKPITTSRGRTGPTGPPGPRGATGQRGDPGPPGHDHTTAITTLRTQVDLLTKELQTQLTRIAQLQAQLDRVETGRASEPRNRRSTDRVEH